MNVQNRHHKPLHPLSHQHQEVEVRRENEPQGPESIWEDQSTAVQKLLERYLHQLPCDHWHPPECQFCKSESGCKFGNKCSFPHRNVEEQPNKKLKKGWLQKCSEKYEDVRELGCVLQDTEPPESSSILRKGTEVLGPISTSTVHSVYAGSYSHPSKQRSIAEWNARQTSSSAQSLRYENWGQISGGDWKTRAMRSRRCVETGQQYLQDQRKGQSYLLLTYQCMEFGSSIHHKTRGKVICCRFWREHAHGDQDSFGWCSGKSVQIEDTWVCAIQNRVEIVRHGDSSEDIGSPLSKVENNGEEEKKDQKTSIMKLRRQAWENLTQEQWSRVERDFLALKEEKVLVTSGKKNVSVRKETKAVYATKPKIVRKNQNTLPPHLLSQPHHEVEVCRK